MNECLYREGMKGMLLKKFCSKMIFSIFWVFVVKYVQKSCNWLKIDNLNVFKAFFEEKRFKYYSQRCFSTKYLLLNHLTTSVR